MQRPISTRMHGIIDYALWITTAGALPRMLNGASHTASLVRSAATAAGVNVMMTDYEAGLVRVMPMKGHLALDFVMCTALMLSPFFLPASERRYAFVPVALGAIGAFTTMLTQTESIADRGVGFMPSRDWSEAVADPDFTRG